VVDEKPFTDSSAGMNLDTRKKTRDMRSPTAAKSHFVVPEKMSRTVTPESMQTRIAKQDFGDTSRRGVSIKNRPDIFSQGSKHN
jgi:hypothetical protein